VSLSDGFALFNTAVGHCGIAWSVNGVVAVQLPEIQGIQQTRTRLVKMLPLVCERPPTPEVQDAISRIIDLLGGGVDDLKSIRLDMSGIPAFSQKVYEVARNIAPGRTLTYGQVASKMSEPGAARAVGQALGRNPFAPVIPCHRVLAAGARLGGFSASGGIATKLRLLQIEGALLSAQYGLFDASRPPRFEAGSEFPKG
jgi:methylated-DNA-[protein]-cysteine S-methyltransferase